MSCAGDARAHDAPKDETMDAIEMLKTQHREVEALFEKYDEKGDNAAKGKQQIFEAIADALAMHAAIEEKHFYPAIKERRTEDILLEGLEEHLAIKRVIADLLKVDSTRRNVRREGQGAQGAGGAPREGRGTRPLSEGEEIFDRDELTAIAAQMQVTMKSVQAKGEPRKAVPAETREAAPLK